MVNYPQDIEYWISLTPRTPGVIFPEIFLNCRKNNDKYQNLKTSLTEMHLLGKPSRKKN